MVDMKTAEEIRFKVATTLLGLHQYQAAVFSSQLEGAEYALSQLLEWIDIDG